MARRKATAAAENSETTPSENVNEPVNPPAEMRASAPVEPLPDDKAETKWVDTGFRGWNHISLGDGRTIHFSRNDSTQQIAIHFEADEGVDPRPAKEDRDFLRANSFQWITNEKKWLRSFFTPEQKAYFKQLSVDNPQQAKLERAQIRAEVNRQGEETFMQLANAILIRNGQEPKETFFRQDRARGA